MEDVIDIARKVFKSGRLRARRGVTLSSDGKCGCVLTALSIAGGGPYTSVLASRDFCMARYGLTGADIGGLIHGFDGRPGHGRSRYWSLANDLATELGA